MRTLPLTLFLVFGAYPVFAQDSAYSEHIRNAVEEHDAGRFEEALTHFLRAHELSPSARTARGVGKTLFELRRYVDATRYLRLALESEVRPLTTAMRAEIADLLLRAQQFIGHFAFVTNVDAEIRVDGALTDSTVDLDVGEHRLVVIAEAHVPIRRTLYVRGGESETLELELVATSQANSDSADTVRGLAIAGMASGGALLAGAVVAHILREEAVGSLNSLTTQGTCLVRSDSSLAPASPSRCFDVRERVSLTETLAIVGYTTGIALALAGTLAWFMAPESAEAGESPARFGCAPVVSGFDLGVHCRMEF